MALFRGIYIRFMEIRRVSLGISALMIAASLFFLATRGLNLGIDFTGGLILQVEFSKATEVGRVRELLAQVGQSQATIQAYSDQGVFIRFSADDDATQKAVVQALRGEDGAMKLLRMDKVGPVVGKQLREEALLALAVSLGGILLYVTLRFQFRFAVVSVLALVHDAIITLGVFSLLQREVGVSFIAAILTIVGYSLNDTIVVLDRVRENWGGVSKGIAPLLNDSINQTLSRTINTSLTTLLAVVALLVWGGPVIQDFSLAMFVGILVGTYSSIYIAGAMLCEWYERSPRVHA